MVAIPTVSGGTMCIDSTEVTSGQYSEFLASAGAAELAAQSPACSWNVTFVPYNLCITGPAVCVGAGCEDHPQVCADQCDAAAYCKWAGKRLCGSLAGGALSYDAFADPTQSMWMNACSAGLTLSAPTNQYPYGNTFDAVACDATPASGCITDQTCTSTPVASHPACVTSGAYAGVYDLSGSTWEWEDACLPGTNGDGYCRVRGGSFQDGSDQLACAADQSLPMFNAYSNIGFRCCSP